MQQEFLRNQQASKQMSKRDVRNAISAIIIRIAFLFGVYNLLAASSHHGHVGMMGYILALVLFLAVALVYIAQPLTYYWWRAVNIPSFDMGKQATLTLIEDESKAPEVFRKKEMSRLEQANSYLDPYGVRISEKNLVCTIQALQGIKSDISIEYVGETMKGQQIVQLCYKTILLIEMHDDACYVYEHSKD